jgi:acyl-CoA thioesterase
MTESAAGRLAQRVGASMFESDQASQHMGMRIEHMGPGSARVSMIVRRDMLNGVGTCHGGLIFMLADSAFAFSCNSHNELSVAAGCSIEFLRPGKEGDVLIAEASEQTRSGRTGVYDITVRNQLGETIALFRGKSHTFKDRTVVPAQGE